MLGIGGRQDIISLVLYTLLIASFVNFVLTFSLVPLMLVCTGRIFRLYVLFIPITLLQWLFTFYIFLLFDYIILFPLSSYVSLVSYFWLFQPFLFVWDPRLFSIMSFVFATFVWFACFLFDSVRFYRFDRFYRFIVFIRFYRFHRFYRFCCFYPFLSFLLYFRI